MNIKERISNFIKTGTAAGSSGDLDTPFVANEKVIAFLIAFIFAFFLWFVINLNRDFTIDLDLPVMIENMPEEKALSSSVPAYASVSLSGEGWQLISLYNNPPRVNLSIESDQVNLFDQVRQQLGVNMDVRVVNVQPTTVEVSLEDKMTRKVPVITRMDITLDDQYGIIGRPVIEPDSVTLTGAISKISNVMAWETEPVELQNVRKDVEKRLSLAPSDDIISIEPGEVLYKVEVAEFTEGEVKVPVRTRNMPPGKAVTYNPSSITVTYTVPIDEFADVQNIRPFIAYVSYQSILEDNTGYITPEIERVVEEYHVRLKNYSPLQVAYFNIVDDSE